MTTWIQVCGVIEEDGECVPFVPDNVADFYGVYICDPMAKWVADFDNKTDALNFAQDLADSHLCGVDDRTFAEREL